ncbi:protein of unknown function [Rhodovastum atsumiense]|nr:protein of unknown function [Rhodovastum atsumiense]
MSEAERNHCGLITWRCHARAARLAGARTMIGDAAGGGVLAQARGR